MLKIINKIQFPEFTGIKCNMMPFIQGNPDSLPDEYKQYSDIIALNFIEKGKIGYLTIDESFVKANKSQRGFNNANINRNVHVEVGRYKNKNKWGNGWGNYWAGKFNTTLDDNTEVLIANSIDNTCRAWDTKEMIPTKNGDLSSIIHKYPENTGILLKAGELVKMSIFTPHECINQKISSNRQFFRIVGEGVKGRENYFTINPKININ
jgi:hypothetical protein